MKWVRHGPNYRSDCDRVLIKHQRGQWWVCFDPPVAPNGITEHPADTLRQAKAIAESVLGQADDLSGLREEAHKRLSDGERYRDALEAIRAHCEASESVDSAEVVRLVDEVLR